MSKNVRLKKFRNTRNASVAGYPAGCYEYTILFMSLGFNHPFHRMLRSVNAANNILCFNHSLVLFFAFSVHIFCSLISLYNILFWFDGYNLWVAYWMRFVIPTGFYGSVVLASWSTDTILKSECGVEFAISQFIELKNTKKKYFEDITTLYHRPSV